MRNHVYRVLDKYGHLLRTFNTYIEAWEFRMVNHRYDWAICDVYQSAETDFQTTDKQKNAVKFVKDILQIEFKGNIDDWRDVSPFLNDYLQQAKNFILELKCEYETDRGY